MEMNRNQFFMFGVVLLLLGIQFRSIDSFVLSEKTTRFLAQQSQPADDLAMRNFVPAAIPMPRKVVRPPQWLGYSLMSIGSVLILHAFGMKKPGG